MLCLNKDFQMPWFGRKSHLHEKAHENRSNQSEAMIEFENFSCKWFHSWTWVLLSTKPCFALATQSNLTVTWPALEKTQKRSLKIFHKLFMLVRSFSASSCELGAVRPKSRSNVCTSSQPKRVSSRKLSLQADLPYLALGNSAPSTFYGESRQVSLGHLVKIVHSFC